MCVIRAACLLVFLGVNFVNYVVQLMVECEEAMGSHRIMAYFYEIRTSESAAFLVM